MHSGFKECPICRIRYDNPKSKYCSKCGVELINPQYKECGQCGSKCGISDKYCEQCGVGLNNLRKEKENDTKDVENDRGSINGDGKHICTT